MQIASKYLASHFACVQHAVGANWYPFTVTDDQWKATFSLEATCGISERFPDTPQTLHTFLTFLEKHSQVEVSMHNNTIQREVVDAPTEGQKAWVYKVSEEQLCVHRITQQFSSSARGVKPSYKNVGALVDSSKVKDATHVQAYVKVECPRRLSLCGWRTTCAMTLSLG